MTVFECVPGVKAPPDCCLCGAPRVFQYWHSGVRMTGICRECARMGDREITRRLDDGS